MEYDFETREKVTAGTSEIVVYLTLNGSLAGTTAS
jgi:hypothetical protein